MNIFSCFSFNILIRVFINNINIISSTIDIISSNILLLIVLELELGIILVL